MKDTGPNPNQLIFISKEASVWSLELGLRLCSHVEPSVTAGQSGGMSSGTTNMPAVYSIWK
jgi:hypothetical protein